MSWRLIRQFFQEGFRGTILPIMFIVIVGSALALLIPRLPTAQATETQIPSGVHILYLRPDLSANQDIPEMNDQWTANGIKVVKDFAILTKLASSKDIDTIIIHKLTLPQVNRQWLSEQRRSEKIIVGINITMRQLSQAIEGTPPDRAWSDGWQQEPFFSMIVETKRSNGGGFFRASDPLYSLNSLTPALTSALEQKNQQ